MNNADISPEEALFRKHIYYGELDLLLERLQFISVHQNKLVMLSA